MINGRGLGPNLGSLSKKVTPKLGSSSREGASHRKVQGKGTAGHSGYEGREVKEVSVFWGLLGG